MLLVYCYAGTVSVIIPSAYFLVGVGLVSIFVVLSGAQFQRQVRGSLSHDLPGWRPRRDSALFPAGGPRKSALPSSSVVFLIFGFGALRMTSRQAIITWTLTMIGLAPIFLFTQHADRAADRYPDRAYRRDAFLCPHDRPMRLRGTVWQHDAQDALRPQLELKAAYKRIEELAELDELTGRPTAAASCGCWRRRSRAPRGSGSPCSIALIDLDWFKRINDAYGHPTGDEVLRTFSITMFASIRSTDRFGRYGGEEFLLVLPDMDTNGAARRSTGCVRLLPISNGARSRRA